MKLWHFGTLAPKFEPLVGHQSAPKCSKCQSFMNCFSDAVTALNLTYLSCLKALECNLQKLQLFSYF